MRKFRSLDPLIQRSVFIIREAHANFENPCVLWSTGKDSTVTLSLIKEATPYGGMPFDVVHIDTGFKFPEMYEFRDRLAREWGFNLVVAQNKETNILPNTGSKINCCTARKTEALKQLLREKKYDGILVSIRWDEHGIRGMERYMSPRDKDWRWKVARKKTKEEMKHGDAPFVSEQHVELAGWNIFQTDFGPECDHVRIHPILHWTEVDCWRYMKLRNLPWNPLYKARKINGKMMRYRSLGCMPCTFPVESNAQTIDEIIEELLTTKEKERSGRAQDKEEDYAMQRLRALGYM